MAAWMGSSAAPSAEPGAKQAQLVAGAQRHESHANDNCLILNTEKYAHDTCSEGH